MQFKNPIHKTIYDQIVQPSIKKSIINNAKGIIVGLDYEQKTVDIRWKEPDTGNHRLSKKISYLTTEAGLIQSTPRIGSEVIVGFYNGTYKDPYIIKINKEKKDEKKDENNYGSYYPKGLGSY